MDFTLLRAGSTTHLKIVAVAALASIAVVVVAINARTERLPTVHSTADSFVVKQASPASTQANLLPFADDRFGPQL